jgi:hypothetical protein
LIVSGLVGEPTAPVTEIAGATNMRRLSLRRAECVRSLEFWLAQLVAPVAAIAENLDGHDVDDAR